MNPIPQPTEAQTWCRPPSDTGDYTDPVLQAAGNETVITCFAPAWTGAASSAQEETHMHNSGKSFATSDDESVEIEFPIPGATPGGVFAKLLNVDANQGLVTTIIHIHPGARIPAHYHNEGAEAHYVIEGDFINEGITYGPGGFVTHPVGVIHGPHESKTGCRILTLQTAYVNPSKPDFHIAE